MVGSVEEDDPELTSMTRRLVVAVVLGVPVLFLAMAPMLGFEAPFGLAPRTRGWVEFALGSPVVLWVGWPILRKFWMSLSHRALNMYTLIGLGGNDFGWPFMLAALIFVAAECFMAMRFGHYRR